MPLLAGNRGRWSNNAVCDIDEPGTARGVDEPVIPRVTDTPAQSRKPLLPHLVAQGRIGGELGRAALLAHGRDIGLQTEDALCALRVDARGDAEETATELNP